MMRVEGNGCQNPYAWKWGVGAGVGMAALLAVKIWWDAPQTKTFLVMEGILGGVAGVAYWCHRHVTVIEQPAQPRKNSIADSLRPSDIQAHIPPGSWNKVALALWVTVGGEEQGAKELIVNGNQALLHKAVRELKAKMEKEFPDPTAADIKVVWVAAIKKSNDSFEVITANRRTQAGTEGYGQATGGADLLSANSKASLLIKDDIRGW